MKSLATAAERTAFPASKICGTTISALYAQILLFLAEIQRQETLYDLSNGDDLWKRQRPT
jgi:hypothetical protein